jgi:hypothetical protein
LSVKTIPFFFNRSNQIIADVVPDLTADILAPALRHLDA